MNENPNKEGKGMDPIVRGALDILTRSEAKGKDAVVTLGDNVSYQTPIDTFMKKGSIEMIDENSGMVLICGDEVAWVNRSFVTKVEKT